MSKYEILDVPAKIFSYSLSKSKKEYYTALKLADQGDFNSYYESMLIMLNDSLELTISFIDSIVKTMNQYKHESNKKTEIAKYLFYGVKTTNRWLVKKTRINNKTVSKYIDELQDEGLVNKERKSKYVLYKNIAWEKIIRTKLAL